MCWGTHYASSNAAFCRYSRIRKRLLNKQEEKGTLETPTGIICRLLLHDHLKETHEHNSIVPRLRLMRRVMHDPLFRELRIAQMPL